MLGGPRRTGEVSAEPQSMTVRFSRNFTRRGRARPQPSGRLVITHKSAMFVMPLRCCGRVNQWFSVGCFPGRCPGLRCVWPLANCGLLAVCFSLGVAQATLCMAVGQIVGEWAAAGLGAEVRWASFNVAVVCRYRGKPSPRAAPWATDNDPCGQDRKHDAEDKM